MSVQEYWLAFAGLLATTIVGVAGLILNHRARNAPFRELLYTKQCELIIQVLAAYAELRDELVVLFGPHDDISTHDAVWHRVRSAADSLAALAPSAATLLPGVIYATYETMHRFALDLLRRIANDSLPKGELDLLMEHGLIFARAARAHLGTDALSVETQQAFASSHPTSLVASLPRKAPQSV